MAQRLHNLSKWIFVGEGHSLSFPKAKRRVVILDVNCPTEVGFYILHVADDPDENPEKAADAQAGRQRQLFAGSEPRPPASDDGDTLLFLGVAKGRERFEFGVEGGFALIVEGGSAYVYSADGLQTETNVVSPVVFTRIANRRARSPELELMQYRMRMNEAERMRALEREAERRIEALEKRLERYMPERGGTPLNAGAARPEGRQASEQAVGDDVPSADAVVTDDQAGRAGKRKSKLASAD